MKLQIMALAIALSLAFTTKPKEWTLLQCFYTSQERDSKMLQIVTAMIFGGYEVTDYVAADRNGYYCYEISYLEPARP